MLTLTYIHSYGRTRLVKFIISVFRFVSECVSVWASLLFFASFCVACFLLVNVC